jgi:hypothetical protein
MQGEIISGCAVWRPVCCLLWLLWMNDKVLPAQVASLWPCWQPCPPMTYCDSQLCSVLTTDLTRSLVSGNNISASDWYFTLRVHFKTPVILRDCHICDCENKHFVLSHNFCSLLSILTRLRVGWEENFGWISSGDRGISVPWSPAPVF